ncbi:AlpA family phage regulatory protein [Phyllobacterium sp. UNC302MFCol5.2]|uniref:helix-turn-helix transcriptional regulator n=1 Tax=Phyllobacterium sp. UNC302MFCol5.2 TaxID=1449065 RepID=UPI000484A18C|nr:AlpA family phage regulatory protein [Phyllobacterium sp. UNC302MFCol5.2]
MDTPDRFLRIDEVKQMVGLSRSQVYALAQAGEFPRPAKLGSSSRWSLKAVQAWMSQMVERAA